MLYGLKEHNDSPLLYNIHAIVKKSRTILISNLTFYIVGNSALLVIIMTPQSDPRPYRLERTG